MFGSVPTVLLCMALGASNDSGNAAAAPPPADARLNDLWFLDARRGWAVGDRGAILRTEDGGAHWTPQNSGVDCTLSAVWFHDEQIGVAVGGFTQPYTRASRGVVLRTRDGGQTWSRDANLLLPALRKVGFFDAAHGWAVGGRSTMFPGGAFLTDDGGQSWRPVPGGASAGWMAGDFLDPRRGFVAGRNGSSAFVLAGELEHIAADAAELRSFAAARLLAPQFGWMAGEGGLVLRFRLDRIEASSLELPKVAKHFDFAALAVRGEKCWLAGSPGTRVFFTPDAGKTWEAFDTGSTLPLHALTFADDRHGFAAGELGVVLATEDGGRTWRPCRSGGRRAAMLALVFEPEDAPLELIARHAGGEGFLVVVEALCRRDLEIAPRDDVPAGDRLHEAVVRAGGSSGGAAWQFPLRQAGLRIGADEVVAAWDRANDGRGLDALLARAVRQIRVWRPDVVVASDPARNGDDAAAVLAFQTAVQAIERAADPAAFPEQIVEAGLKPWRVRRAFAAMPPGSRGSCEINTAQFLPALGRSVAEAAAAPRGLLLERFAPSPPMLAFRALALGGDDEPNRRDFFAGLDLAPGGEARRASPAPAANGGESSRRAAVQRRHAQAILQLARRGDWSPESLLAQLDDLTRDLDETSAGEIVFQLADQCARGGHRAAATETYQVLVERWPRHPLASEAIEWLLHYYASGEEAWRERCDPARRRKRLERAVAVGRAIERERFERFVEPAVRFPLAAAYRGLGQSREAKRLYQTQMRGADDDGWWACAQCELRLGESEKSAGDPLKPRLLCARAEAKPHLDGRLDDPVWKKAAIAPLRSAMCDDGAWPASVQAAYDDEYFYWAARCRRPPRGDGANAAIDDGSRNARRPRDADLSDHDRVELFLDIDRDYCTYYRLAIDHRGWTNDRCWDDAGWNPQWFVAARADGEAWTAEAAVPMAELAGNPPRPGDAWVVGVQRVAPGAGFQAWSRPAAVAVLPDGFGLLVFQ